MSGPEANYHSNIIAYFKAKKKGFRPSFLYFLKIAIPKDPTLQLRKCWSQQVSLTEPPASEPDYFQPRESHVEGRHEYHPPYSPLAGACRQSGWDS